MVIAITKQILERNTIFFLKKMKLHLTCNNYIFNAYSLHTFATIYFFKKSTFGHLILDRPLNKPSIVEQTYDLNITNDNFFFNAH
jgi:hypothetical protein